MKVFFAVVALLLIELSVLVCVLRSEPVLTMQPSPEEFSCLKLRFDQSEQWTFWIEGTYGDELRIRGGKYFGEWSPLYVDLTLDRSEFGVDDESFMENGSLAFAGIRTINGRHPACGSGVLLGYWRSTGFRVLW